MMSTPRQENVFTALEKQRAMREVPTPEPQIASPTARARRDSNHCATMESEGK